MTVVDCEIATELLEAFNDLAEEIEFCLDRLSAIDTDNLNALFRAVHTIKGNAAMAQLNGIVDFTHSVEEVVGSLRTRHLSPSDLICEALQLGMDRLRDLHQRELLGHEFENLHENELKGLYRLIAQAQPEDADKYSRQVLQLFGADFVYHELPTAPDYPDIECIITPVGHSRSQYDLHFFRELARQTDRQSRYWVGRSEQLQDWAQKVNALRGEPVDPTQLAAATYMHDMGMSFIPNQVLEKAGKLTTEEISEIRQHPLWSYKFLQRMPGWDEAATIVLEHHERIDGKGYPNGNSGKLIHEGAKILAVIDAFFSITNGRADRARRRSVVRAVSEINSRVGTQFDRESVAKFNEMIKNELKSGAL